MKIYYIDAENVGIDVLKDKSVSVLDKVYVFSNNKSVNAECDKRLYIAVSGYPVGKNQADFYMVGHVARLISLLSNKEKGIINFIFCTKDQDLLKALFYQCSSAGIKIFSSCPVIKEKKSSGCVGKANNKSHTQKGNAGNSCIENLILQCFAQPSKLYDVQVALGLSQSDFAIAVNKLANAGKIERQSKSSKKWRRI